MMYQLRAHLSNDQKELLLVYNEQNIKKRNLIKFLKFYTKINYNGQEKKNRLKFF